MKKLTALLLALLMLALPVASLAGSPSDLFSQATEGKPYKMEGKLSWGNLSLLDDASQSLVKDVVNAISFTYASQENQSDFAMQLSGNDVLTLSTATQGEDTYLLSNLLGSTIAYNDAESVVILDHLMQLAVAADMMTQSDVEQARAAIQQALAQGEITATTDIDIDIAALTTWAEDFASRVTTEEVTQQPKNSDAAAKVLTFTLTGDDLTEMYTILFDSLKNNPSFINGLNSATLNMDGQPITAEELAAQLPEVARKIGNAVQGDIPVTVYVDAEDRPVYGTASVTMLLENEGQPANITMDMGYTRLTISEGETHTFNIDATDPEKNGISLSAAVLNTDQLTIVSGGFGAIENGTATPSLGLDLRLEKKYGDTESELDMEALVTIISDGQEITLGLDMEKETKMDGQDAVYEGDMDISFMGEELLCVKVTAATGEAAPSIVTADAVRPGQMTEEDFNAYVESDVMMSLQMALVNLIQSLPTSVLSLLMSN